MMYDEEIIDRGLRILQKKPVDGYEIYFNRSSHFDIESKEGKIETLQTDQYMGMAFRILNHQQIGFSYTTLSNPSSSAPWNFSDELDRMIEDAIRSAKPTSPDPCFDFAPALQGPLPELSIFDESLEGISEKMKIEKAKDLEAATRAVDPEKIKKVRKASYQEVLSRTTLVNSNGIQNSYAHSLASVSVTAVAEDSGESEVAWDFDASHFFKDLDVEKVGRSAGRKAVERLGGKRIPSGAYPVLLRNHVAAEFLSLLAHSFFADQVQKGKSPLKGKRGERFFSSLLTIVDDGLYPEGVSTAPFDGEGMPSQRTCLVTEGELTQYLFDRYWANRERLLSPGLKEESTGNSRRAGIKFPPGVGISNFFIEPGKIELPQMLEGFLHGIVVEEVMGLHTVDPISGDFSLGCSGDWIDRGQRVHPVKSVAIAGNLFELFKGVIGVGKDLRFFGAVGAPSLLIKELVISGN